MQRIATFLSLLFLSVSPGFAQSVSNDLVTDSHAQALVPRLIKVNGALKNSEGGQVHAGTVGANLAIYKDELGGTPLWQETQNVVLDGEGRYTVLLGSSTAEGIPLDLFASGEARWLSVQIQGEQEQPRVLLVSVPYALKAGDAETLEGKSASAFVLAPSFTKNASGGSQAVAATAGAAPTAAATIGGGGTSNVVTKFDSTGINVINSSVTDNGSSVTTSEPVGIGTTSPGAQLDVEFTTAAPTNAMLSNINYNNTTAVTNAVVSAFDMNFLDSSTAANLSKQTARIAYIRQAAATGGVTAFDSALTATAFLFANAPFALRGINIEGPTVDAGHTLANFTGLYIGSPGGAGTTTNKTALVTEPNAGNVGIGTTTPTAPLDVNGLIRARGGLQFSDGSVQSSANCTSNCGGTITGVTGGTGLTGGGSSGSVTLALNTGFTDGRYAQGITAGTGLTASGGLPAPTVALNTSARTRAITYLAGCDSCSTLTTADSQASIFLNVIGSMSIVAVQCFTDTGTTNINLNLNGAANFLNGDLACSTSGATSGSISQASALNDKLNFVITKADGAAHRVTVSITGLVN
jgi:hypothetical protein